MIPLVDRDDIAKRKRVSKYKREKYKEMKKRVSKLLPNLFLSIDENHRDIMVKVRDIAKDLGLENKSDGTIYAGLRYVLFFEGISVSIRNFGKEDENCLIMGRIGSDDGLGTSVVKTFDNRELDGWYIKREYYHLKIKHCIKKDGRKDETGGDIYILESDGNIFFDRRDLTYDQALAFVRYMCKGGGERAPDWVYNTPINVVLNKRFLERSYDAHLLDVVKTGTEFRIVKSADQRDKFIATSIYGKECEIYEHDFDSLFREGSLFNLLNGFNKTLMMERVPERIEMLKIIIPEIGIKSKCVATIKGNMLLIVNRIGSFQISLIDGTLHKITDRGNKYICVGPMASRMSNLIIHNGVKYKLDNTTGSIISKMIMLAEEKYPDLLTKSQVIS